MEKLKTAIKELNEVLEGGLPTPSALLILGDPGAGKTTFCIQMLKGLENKKVMMLTNNTPAEAKLILDRLQLKGDVEFIDCYSWLSGEKADVDSLTNLSRLLIKVEDALKEGSVFILDSLTPLIFYNDEEEIERFVQQLGAIVKSKKSIALIILDSGTYPLAAERAFQAMCDGVLVMEVGKGIKVTKMVDAAVHEKQYFYEITDKGIKMRNK